MNKTETAIRAAILLIFLGMAMFLLFCEEQDTETSAFLLHVLIDKSLAVALFYICGRLLRRWSAPKADIDRK